MGKRYRNLIGRIADPDNLRAAYQQASRGRRNSVGYLKFKEYEAAWLEKLRRDILDKTYRPGRPREFWVYEPKPRPITAAPFQDRVVQHALCNVIGPIFEAGMLPQAYACRKGRGMHSGAIRTQALMRQVKRRGELHCLKTDFSKYFYSIDRAVLWRRIEAKISCQHTLWLIEQFTPRDGVGLPIGFTEPAPSICPGSVFLLAVAERPPNPPCTVPRSLHAKTRAACVRRVRVSRALERHPASTSAAALLRVLQHDAAPPRRRRGRSRHRIGAVQLLHGGQPGAEQGCCLRPVVSAPLDCAA